MVVNVRRLSGVNFYVKIERFESIAIERKE